MRKMFISFPELSTSTGSTTSTVRICILCDHLLLYVKILEIVRPALDAKFAKNPPSFSAHLQFFKTTEQIKVNRFRR